MISGSPFGLLLEAMVPFFVFGLGLWIWVLLQVRRERWADPRHWVKAVVTTAGIVVGLVPLSLVLVMLTLPLWALWG